MHCPPGAPFLELGWTGRFASRGLTAAPVVRRLVADRKGLRGVPSDPRCPSVSPAYALALTAPLCCLRGVLCGRGGFKGGRVCPA